MRIQTAKQQYRLQEWAQQIKSCIESGLTIKQWCNENGVKEKTYYYRLKRVQEELFERMPKSIQPMQLSAEETSSDLKEDAKIASLIGTNPQPPPIFAALPILQSGYRQRKNERSAKQDPSQSKPEPAAITVCIGRHSIEIRNNAAGWIIKEVLRAVTQL